MKRNALIETFMVIMIVSVSMVFINLIDSGSIPYIAGYELMFIMAIAFFDLVVFGLLFYR